MIVCHCKAISDRTIREAIERGARTPRQAAMASNAGRSCGGCMPVVREILQRECSAEAEVVSREPCVAAG